MIPLNKPLICNQGKLDIISFLTEMFPTKSIFLTFSARQALNIIYKHLKFKNGICKVAVSPLTCFEALTPIIDNNHIPVFIDIDHRTFLMNTSLIPEEIKFIQAIHLGGMPMIVDSKSKDVTIIDDCAQSFGTEYNGKPVGSTGNYAAFSFMKNIYSLGGGFMLSDAPLHIEKEFHPPGISTIYYRKLKRKLESHLSYKNNLLSLIYTCLLSLKPSEASMSIKEFRLNNILIESIEQQLFCYDYLKKRRNEIAHQFLNLIDPDKYTPQKVASSGNPVYTRLFFRSKKIKSHALITMLRNKGIAANNLSQNYLIPYQKNIFEVESFQKYIQGNPLTNYNRIHQELFCIPISPALSQNEIYYTTKILNEL